MLVEVEFSMLVVRDTRCSSFEIGIGGRKGSV